ncbi:RuvB-like domain-containing protein [Marvinbryantia sp.]|uniref:RuvB-like domain-containing protein n=1 Tax=Marvinbryantia sp. TaxID=2496532 RepID=UPI0025EC053A|nr:RuvB-like domain-containing protein [uncultured Marvinbryantia sp.]
MDKFEYQAKLEEINKLVEKENYEEAAKIADTIEWKRVRSVRTLCLISEIYEAVGRAEDSKAILYRAYRRSPGSRQILYRLTEACVQTQEFDDAVEYYTEYVNLSPNDNSKYILKYEIYKGRGSSLEEQIAVLEELKSREYTEQWAYELARLYDEAGMVDKCVAECDDLALWFHNGKYVVAALELKKKYVPLTPEQQTVYDNPSEIVDMETKEQVVDKAVPTLDEVITKELPKSEKDAIADSIIMDTERQIAAAVQAPVMPQIPEEPEEKAPEIRMPELRMPVNDINTIDLQSELANSMREILSGIRPASSTDELESAPTLVQPAAAEAAAEEEELPKHVSIDDILTGTAVQTDEQSVQPQPQNVPSQQEKPVVRTVVDTAAGQQEGEGVQPVVRTVVETPVQAQKADPMTAPTIDISRKIRQEIGDTSIRAYAAAAQRNAARQSQETGSQAAPAMEPKSAERQAAPVMEPKTSERQAAPAMEPKTSERQAAPAMEIKSAEPQAVSAPEPQKPETFEQPAVSPEDYTREGLDEKEKAMLGFWSQISGMNEQINDAVTQIIRGVIANKTSSSGNVVLVGDAGNGRTTLAISLAKIISRCKGQTSVKVAKIYAEDLNKKDIAATVNKMAGGVLIIEEAGDLSDEAVSQMTMAMDFKTDSLVVVLEDEQRYLQDLLARNAAFAEKFNVTINVPMLTNDELVDFGEFYALENGCSLDGSAVDALYECIGAMQSPEQPVAVLDVKEIMDKAIKNANRFGVGKLTSSISGKRYDENDRVILKGKNFKKIK